MDENLKKELKQLDRRKQKARNANDLAEEAKLCNVAGELLAEHRLFEQAIEQHTMELHLSESLDDPIAVAISHRKIGECLCECQDFKQAIFHQQQYLKISKKCEDKVEQQRAHATIGRVWFLSAVNAAEMEKALASFIQSLAMCEQLHELVKEKELLQMKTRLYLNLGLVYNNLNNQKKGIRYIEKALTIAVNQNLKDTEYRCHFSLGEIKLSKHHPAEALQCFERARKVAQHQKKNFDEADALVQMGLVLIHLGDFEGAKKILKKCFQSMKFENLVTDLRSNLVKAIKGTQLLETLQSGPGNELLMKTYEDLGDLFSSVKCFSKAVHYYLKQLDLSEKLCEKAQERAVICVSIAASYSDNKQYEKAKQYFQKELSLREGEPLKQCDTWCNIAEVCELANEGFESIEKAYNNALECASENPQRKRRVVRLLTELQKRHCSESCEEIEDCKMDESEASESQCSEEQDVDDYEEEEQLIQEEMELSDQDSDEQEEKIKRTKIKNKRNEKGETELHVAAIKGDYRLAERSINKGVSVHSRDYCGWQPLHEACNHGNLHIVELLLDKGADINDPGGPHCRGMTPLHDAVQNGHVDVVTLLIARGACVSQENKDGNTPLDLVLHAIANDNDDDDSVDPELSEVREDITRILRNAMCSTKRHRIQELRRRDKIDLSDVSDDSDVSAEKQLSKKAGGILRPASCTIKRRSPQPSQLRRRDKLEYSDESDTDSENTSNNFRGEQQVSRNADQRSRKRRSGLLESDEEDMTESIEKNMEWNEEKFGEILEDFDTWLEGGYDGMNSDSDDRMSDTIPVRVTPRRDSKLSGRLQDKMLGMNDTQENGSCERHLVEMDPMDHTKSSLQSQANPDYSLDISPSIPLTSTLGNKGSTCSGKRMRFIERNEVTPDSTSCVDPVTGCTQAESWGSDRPALIPETEYLETSTENWLIDDLPKTGKRKRSADTVGMLRMADSAHKNSSPLRTLSNIPQRSFQPHQRNRNRSNKKTRLRQSKLNIVSGPSSPDELWNITPPDPLTSSSSSVARLPEAPMRLRVKVKDKTFLVPCQNIAGEKKTVQWLAEQATLRYYSSSGLKPILSLSTAEGASLSKDDLIIDVLSNNEQVVATVEAWDLPPVLERYEAACLNTDAAVHEGIVNMLQNNPRISNVDLADMALSSVTWLPLFRALQCHDQLVRLSLPGNRLGDVGVQHFISSLPSLPNLAVLNLSCNGITHKALRNLASSLNEDDKISRAWCNLKDFDISFNTITDIAASSLATILRSCPDLRVLNIESCGLGENTFHQRSTVTEAMQGLTRLRRLNVSRNHIQGKNLTPLLAAISHNCVEDLDISSTLQNKDFSFTIALAEFLNDDECSVQNLCCRGCYFDDEDIAILARAKNLCTSLKKLDLSRNNIGDEGAMKLAESAQSQIRHLSLSGNLKLTNHSLLKVLARSSSLQHLDFSSCGLLSPLEVTSLNFHASRLLKFLNLSDNCLSDQDLEILAKLWNSKWGQESCIFRNKSIFSIQK